MQQPAGPGGGGTLTLPNPLSCPTSLPSLHSILSSHSSSALESAECVPDMLAVTAPLLTPRALAQSHSRRWPYVDAIIDALTEADTFVQTGLRRRANAEAVVLTQTNPSRCTCSDGRRHTHTNGETQTHSGRSRHALAYKNADADTLRLTQMHSRPASPRMHRAFPLMCGKPVNSRD